jgi:DNA-binding CsgD family transcriptional regulator
LGQRSSAATTRPTATGTIRPTRLPPIQVSNLGDGKRLVVEAPTVGALVVTEEEAPPAALTAREIEVLSCIADGRTSSEIARLLWLTPATVRKHLEDIYRKLGVSSRTAALAAAGLKADSLLQRGA